MGLKKESEPAQWIAVHQASLSLTTSQDLLKLMSIELMMPSNHLILCCPLLLPSIFPSMSIFSNELALHIRWPKYWSFNFSISPSNECSGLISFRIDWFDFQADQGSQESSPAPQLESINSYSRDGETEAQRGEGMPPGATQHARAHDSSNLFLFLTVLAV